MYYFDLQHVSVCVVEGIESSFFTETLEYDEKKKRKVNFIKILKKKEKGKKKNLYEARDF